MSLTRVVVGHTAAEGQGDVALALYVAVTLRVEAEELERPLVLEEAAALPRTPVSQLSVRDLDVRHHADDGNVVSVDVGSGLGQHGQVGWTVHNHLGTHVRKEVLAETKVLYSSPGR